MPSVMWKELTAEDLRAKAAENAIVVLPVANPEIVYVPSTPVQAVPMGVLPAELDEYTSTSTLPAGSLEAASVTVPLIWPPAAIAASIEDVVEPAVTATASELASVALPS